MTSSTLITLRGMQEKGLPLGPLAQGVSMIRAGQRGKVHQDALWGRCRKIPVGAEKQEVSLLSLKDAHVCSTCDTRLLSGEAREWLEDGATILSTTSMLEKLKLEARAAEQTRLLAQAEERLEAVKSRGNGLLSSAEEVLSQVRSVRQALERSKGSAEARERSIRSCSVDLVARRQWGRTEGYPESTPQGEVLTGRRPARVVLDEAWSWWHAYTVSARSEVAELVWERAKRMLPESPEFSQIPTHTRYTASAYSSFPEWVRAEWLAASRDAVQQAVEHWDARRAEVLSRWEGSDQIVVFPTWDEVDPHRRGEGSVRDVVGEYPVLSVPGVSHVAVVLPRVVAKWVDTVQGWEHYHGHAGSIGEVEEGDTPAVYETFLGLTSSLERPEKESLQEALDAARRIFQ